MKESSSREANGSNAVLPCRLASMRRRVLWFAWLIGLSWIGPNSRESGTFSRVAAEMLFITLIRVCSESGVDCASVCCCWLVRPPRLEPSGSMFTPGAMFVRLVGSLAVLAAALPLFLLVFFSSIFFFLWVCLTSKLGIANTEGIIVVN